MEDVLQDDEIAYLKNDKRCLECGHLAALHNVHCCVFCKVSGCECQWPEDAWDW